MGSSGVNRNLHSLASVTRRWMEWTAHGRKGTIIAGKKGIGEKKDRDLGKALHHTVDGAPNRGCGRFCCGHVMC